MKTTKAPRQHQPRTQCLSVHYLRTVKIKHVIPLTAAIMSIWVVHAHCGTTFTQLYSYSDYFGYPQGQLVEGSDGQFYGTTCYGGAGDIGMVYKITTNGVRSTLISFDYLNGANPGAGLIRSTDGNFYGTTVNGGAGLAGTVYEVTPLGNLTTLYSFTGGNDGANPSVLLLGKDGFLYGATLGGLHGEGTVFKLTTAGILTSVYSFSGGDDGAIVAGLSMGTDGNLYGTTSQGGTYGSGVAFRMTTAGTITTLHAFSGGDDGGAPASALVLAGDGSLYGVASSGGSCRNLDPSGLGYGAVFRIAPDGTFASVASFDNTDGANPDSALLQGADGSFYGTTAAGLTYYWATGDIQNFGTVFQMSPGGVITTLVSFDWMDGLGGTPNGLTEGSDGNLYGTTLTGIVGQSDIGGTVFRLAPAPAPPVSITVYAHDGGASGPLLSGVDLTGTDGAGQAFDQTTGAEGFATITGAAGNWQFNAARAGYSAKSWSQDITADGRADAFLTRVVPAVATPAFSPQPGTFPGTVTVRASTTTSGATIRYTTAGTDPNSGSPPFPPKGLPLTTTTTLNASAFKTGMADSAVTTGVYTITPQPAPVFDPPPGTLPAGMTVHASTTTIGAVIRYTTNGLGPIGSSPVFPAAGVKLTTTTTLKAGAFKTGMAPSAVTTGTYTIIPPPSSAYNPQSAVAYARKYSKLVCGDGYFWKQTDVCPDVGAGKPVPTGDSCDLKVGDDCAHFVSCCIGAETHEKGGGLPLESTVPPAYGNPSAGGLTATLLQGMPVGFYSVKAVEESSVTSLTPGDVIAYNAKGDSSTGTDHIKHVVLYLGNKLVAAHSASEFNVPYDTTYAGGSEALHPSHYLHISVAASAPAAMAEASQAPPDGGPETPLAVSSLRASSGPGPDPGSATPSVAKGRGFPEPVLANPALVGSTFSVSVSTVLGADYSLQFKTPFADANWTTAQTLPGTGATITLTDSTATNTTRLYRVTVRPSPDGSPPQSPLRENSTIQK